MLHSLFLPLLLASTPQLSEASALDYKQYVMCRQRKIVRTIRVTPKAEGGCRTFYTKAGVDREVGEGRNVSHCKGILNNIMGNLQAANWKCRDISGKARISTFQEP